MLFYFGIYLNLSSLTFTFSLYIFLAKMSRVKEDVFTLAMNIANPCILEILILTLVEE